MVECWICTWRAISGNRLWPSVQTGRS